MIKKIDLVTNFLKFIFIVLTMVFIIFVVPVSAAKRVALVIGNSDYKSSPLKNPVNDARDMKTVLEKVGFKVIIRTNADKEKMLLAIDSFAKELKRSRVGLFFYAGHGMQIKGENYLIPVNAHISSETDVEYSAVHAGRVLGKMEGAGNKMNIVILDACRDNPFKRSFRSHKVGLARMDAPIGSIIAYATAPGSVSSDGTGRNGTYTKNLIQQIPKKGLSLNDLFMEVRKGVLTDTKSKQVPWEESSLTGRFYFAKSSTPLVQQPFQKQVKANPVVKQNKSTTPRPGDTWVDNHTGMTFVWVPGGCYQMGSNSGGSDEKPVHEVCMDGFWMGKYEVTNQQFRLFKSNHNSKDYKGVNLNQGNQPAVYVSWNDARAYVSWLNKKGNGTFQLPSEAQWEYAVRAGTTTKRFWGNDADSACQYANVHDRTSKGKFSNFNWANHNCNDGYAVSSPVGSFKPNRFGLYDMLGNVWEWCEDIYDKNAYDKPMVEAGGSNRVFRGGSWSLEPANVRCADRYRLPPDFTNFNLGFRILRIP